MILGRWSMVMLFSVLVFSIVEAGAEEGDTFTLKAMGSCARYMSSDGNGGLTGNARLYRLVDKNKSVKCLVKIIARDSALRPIKRRLGKVSLVRYWGSHSGCQSGHYESFRTNRNGIAIKTVLLDYDSDYRVSLEGTADVRSIDGPGYC